MSDSTEPTVSFAQARAILVRAARLFRPYRRPIAAVAVIIVLSSGLSVANPLLRDERLELTINELRRAWHERTRKPF